MGWWRLFDFFSFLFFIFIAWQILKGLLFWLWLWQLKEYRLDRLRAHLGLPVGQRQLLNSFNIFSSEKWRFPKLTLRILLSFLLVVFIDYNLYFSLLKLSSFFVKRYPNFLFFAFSFVLLMIFLLLPIIINFAVFAFSFIIWPVSGTILLLAKKRIDSLKPLVIGITGSFGKTSTKFILSQVLSGKFNVLATSESINTPLGVAKAIILKLKKEHEIFIVEMGAYKLGEVKKLCWLVSPKIGVLTGIGGQHQALFGSFQNIKKAKYELIKALPKGGLAVFNYQNPTSRSLGKLTRKVAIKFYGKTKKKYKTKLIGKFQQINIDAAVTIASFLKIPEKDIIKAVKNLEPTSCMLQQVKRKRGAIILNDSFNANYDGFLAGLDVLTDFKDKRKVVITPGIIELGEQQEKIHEQLAKKINTIANAIFLTDDNFYESFKRGLAKKDQKKLFLIKEKSDFVELIKNYLNSKTVILLEGRVPSYVKEVALGK